jgi:hypothetical protein
MKIRWISLAILLPLMCTACVPEQGSASSPSNNEITENSPQSATLNPTAASTPQPGKTSISEQDGTPDVETSTLPAITPPPAAQEVVSLSIEDLSRRLNLNPDQISVVEVLPVVWRDASLGCPKPGIDYIRVEMPGYRIVVEAGGQVYKYHTDEDRRVILCET